MQLTIILQLLIASVLSLLVWFHVFRHYEVPFRFVFVSHTAAAILGGVVFVTCLDLSIERRAGTSIGLMSIPCPLAAMLIYARRKPTNTDT
jgi:hypothetical protein